MRDADICYPQDCPTCPFYDECRYRYGKKKPKEMEEIKMPDIEHLNMKIDWSALTEEEQLTLHQLLTKAHSAYETNNSLYADLLMEQREQM